VLEGLKELDKAAVLMKTKKRRPWPPPGRVHMEGRVPRPTEEAWGGVGSQNGAAQLKHNIKPVDRWASTQTTDDS